MNRQLSEIGNVPVMTSVIKSLYPELKSPDKKVVWLEKNGYIIRLKIGREVFMWSIRSILERFFRVS